ncbi:hypothetical protein ACFY5J_25005 [Peribacillus butanolivorans]|uniref:hypothetical protein n=1 Tax=Peribacillus butanolivorans TaxID=421767 RepID=UPI003674EA83
MFDVILQTEGRTIDFLSKQTKRSKGCNLLLKEILWSFKFLPLIGDKQEILNTTVISVRLDFHYLQIVLPALWRTLNERLQPSFGVLFILSKRRNEDEPVTKNKLIQWKKDSRVMKEAAKEPKVR